MSLSFRKFTIVDKVKHAKSYDAGVRAYCNITINDMIEVNDFRVLEHKNGLWVAPPNKKVELKNGTTYMPIFAFKNRAHNDMLAEDIIKKYKAVLNGAKVNEEEEKEVEAIY